MNFWYIYDLYILSPLQASLVAQLVKNPPAMWDTWVRSLGWEDLEKGMATHFSILAWRIPWTKESGKLQSMGSQKSWTWLSNFHLHIFGKISSCCTRKYKPPTTSVHDLWLTITTRNLILNTKENNEYIYTYTWSTIIYIQDMYRCNLLTLLYTYIRIYRCGLVAQLVKNLQSRRLRLDPWIRKIPWRGEWLPTPVFLLENSRDREPGGLQSMGSQRVGHDWAHTHTQTFRQACSNASLRFSFEFPSRLLWLNSFLNAYWPMGLPLFRSACWNCLYTCFDLSVVLLIIRGSFYILNMSSLPAVYNTFFHCVIFHFSHILLFSF